METTKERPILFSGPMIRAILAGTKTQTRRPVKPQPPEGMQYVGVTTWARKAKEMGSHGWATFDESVEPKTVLKEFERVCPYGQPGNRLWVRETWASLSYRPAPGTIVYRANTDDGERVRVDAPWRPSIHMPKWASRITLEITDVRVQRLQEISEEDALAEGVAQLDGHFGNADTCAMAKRIGCPAEDSRATFALLWDSINAKRGHGWDVNPFVWAITFKRVEE